MLKKYKNGFIDVIRKHGLDPADFTVSDTSDVSAEDRMNIELVFALQFRDTGLKFEVINAAHTLHDFAIRYTRFDVGFPTEHLLETGRSPYVRDEITIGSPIQNVYARFADWLDNEVKPYIEEMSLPDLWQQIQQQKRFVTADPLTDYETSPFTEPETRQVRASVMQFRVLICESFDPTQEQLAVIDEKLDYLSAAVDRPINRFDWKGIALSTVISISIALSLDTDRGRQLFELFKQVFSEVLRLLPGS